MKKFSIIFAALATVLGFTACEDDKDPVINIPQGEAAFVLNTPPLADQFYELEPGNTIEFTTSQPDYGFTASVTYGIQVNIPDELKPAGADLTAYVNLETNSPHSAKISIDSKALGEAIAQLRGITTASEWTKIPAHEVYIRATAQLGDNEKTFLTSNWITLKMVQEQVAMVREPAFIYFVGQAEGWAGPDEGNAEHYADWRLFEKDNEIGSKIFYGVFDIPAGEAMFRIYTKLTGWDGGDSMGYQVEDNATDFKMVDGMFQSELISGKGSFNFPGWEGGYMTIIVDLSKKPYTITMMAGDQL